MNESISYLDLLPLAPEIVATCGIMVVLFADFFTSTKNSRLVCAAFGVITNVLAAGIITALLVGHSVLYPFSEILIVDAFAFYMRLFFYSASAVIFLLIMATNEFGPVKHGEIVSLILGATLGASILVMANNLLIYIFALETLSICSYVLASAKKFNRASAEAGMKYFLYGALTTAMTVYGFSYIYGLSKTLNIERSMELLANYDSGALLVVVLLLSTAAILFKLAIAPFHFWCPDVYQGSPTPITAFLAVVSKAAIFAALFRLLLPASLFMFILGKVYGQVSSELFVYLLFLLAGVTMTLANISALKQNDFKRLLGYSAIAHAGYMLLAFSVLHVMAIKSLMFYFLVYGIANIGAFWICSLMIARYGHAHLSAWRGLGKTNPTLVICLFIFLLSLIGLPPTAGFSGKFLLFSAVMNQALAILYKDSVLGISYLLLILLAVLNSVISLVYYIKPIKVAVLEESDPVEKLPVSKFSSACLIVLAVLSLLLIDFDLVIANIKL
ncbi:MAG: NADH-quinone oxidoreductase subunit N [Deltaproteobacteria bacterium]|nr:NADH-quinone oxidoreductase subunit N [Deltaproteobacteria bacterium]